MAKKIVGSYQHNVYVSAKTKLEFKKDKEQFKMEGIKSAYSLQKQKNILSRMEAIEKASGTYGRFDEAVKKIDPREE